MFETFVLFLAGSAFVYWSLLVLFVLAMIYAVETTSPTGATFTVILAALAAYFIYGFSTVGYVMEHPLYSLGYVGAYFLAGTVWAGVKWMFFVNSAARAYGEIPESKRSDSFSFRGRSQSVPPQVKENKADIMIWMSYWPFSFVWTMIDDPVKRTFNWIYYKIAGGLQRYSNAAFADLHKAAK